MKFLYHFANNHVRFCVIDLRKIGERSRMKILNCRETFLLSQFLNTNIILYIYIFYVLGVVIFVFKYRPFTFTASDKNVPSPK